MTSLPSTTKEELTAVSEIAVPFIPNHHRYSGTSAEAFKEH
jgi:hypothetical protein